MPQNSYQILVPQKIRSENPKIIQVMLGHALRSEKKFREVRKVWIQSQIFFGKITKHQSSVVELMDSKHA